MSLIVLSRISLAFGHVALLDDADFSLQAGERVGLIGRNGSGKSSLLAILAGSRQADDGRRVLQQGLRISLVQQEPALDETLSIFEQTSSGLAEVVALREEFQQLSLQAPSPELTEQLSRLSAKLDTLEGWTWEQRVHEVLHRLGLDPDTPVANLSGGQQKRVALACALVAMPDVLLLDEPTNHLDMEAILWLEELLRKWNGAMVFITHDRAFLDGVCTTIVELDRGMLRRYPGRFSEYRRLKDEELAAQSLANARSDRLLAQEEAWIRRGIEARRTRSASRIGRLEKLREQRERRRDVMGHARLQVASGQMSGKVVAELEGVCKSFDGQEILRHVDVTILRGDRIGIIGPNGAGKTTLLRIILGELAPDQGRASRGTRLEVAYFDQMRARLDLDASLQDFISPGSEWIDIAGERKHVKSYLGDFLFPPQRAASPVRSLSGGERNRLLLARLFARPANVLVLDEPTNDLDIETLELLEELLQHYPGTVFLVSHDRAFLDQVVTGVIAWEGQGRWREFVGGIEDWMSQSGQAKTTALDRAPTEAGPRPKRDTRSQPPVTRPPKMSNKDRQTLASLPELIERLEAEQTGLNELLARPETYRDATIDVGQLSQRVREVALELEQAMTHWEELLHKESAAADRA